MARDLLGSAKQLVPLSVKRAVKRNLGRTDPTPRRVVPSHRIKVGGLWDRIGDLQLEYLIGQGLSDRHSLLDIGCGAMRGGVKFAHYLQPGHYFGVDADERLLSAARQELTAAGVSQDDVALRHTADFDLDFGVAFDFALAQSVFTHLPLNSIQLCLAKVAKVLAPDGRFYATFFHNPHGVQDTEPITWSGTDTTITTYFDRNPYHYDLSAFRWMCEGIDLEVTYIGGWGHPRGQEMLLFTRPATEPASAFVIDT